MIPERSFRHLAHRLLDGGHEELAHAFAVEGIEITERDKDRQEWRLEFYLNGETTRPIGVLRPQ